MNFELLVLDTNFYSALAKNDPQARGLIRAAREIALPLIVIGELMGGFHHGSRFEKNMSELQAVLAKPSCRILMPSIETAENYGQLYAHLKRQGKMIATNDIWIAALTIEYEGVFATHDTDFDDIPGLQLAIDKA